jgi:hypothetical protein
MPGIPSEVTENKLGIDLVLNLVKQKERKYTLDKRETICQEVTRLFQA